MFGYIAKWFFQLLGWNDLPDDTKNLITTTTKTQKDLLLIFPNSSEWDLPIMLSFLWCNVVGSNWFIVAENLPWYFMVFFPMKRKIAGRTAWCLHWTSSSSCDIYLASECDIEQKDLGAISQCVGVIGPNYHPQIRQVHAAAQSAKYETSTDYIPYYLTQFVRLNNCDRRIVTPTYIRKRGITYKSCAIGKTVLSPFDLMCVAYFTNIVCSVLVAFHNVKLAGIAAVLNVFLLIYRAHEAASFMPIIVHAKIALECIVSDHPGTIFSCFNLMMQSALLFWTTEHKFSWSKKNFNRHLVVTIGAGLSMIIHTFSQSLKG